MAPSGPPTWLFGGGSNSKAGKPSKPTAGKKTKKKDKAKEANEVKDVKEDKRAHGAKRSGKAAPMTKKQTPVAQPSLPAQLLDMIDNFLTENAFDKAHRAFQKQRLEREAVDAPEISGKPSENLLGIYRFWEAVQVNASRKSKVASKADEAGTVSDGSDSSSSSSASSSFSSEDESRHQDLKKTRGEAQTSSSSLKRKAPSRSSSSASSSDSDSSSSAVSSHADEAPRSKKQKTVSAGQPLAAPDDVNRIDVDGSSTCDSDASGDSDSAASSSKPGLSSGGESGSDSESSSDSEASTEVQMAACVPLPGSDSSSTSSDSDSEDDGPKTAAPGLANKPAKPVSVAIGPDSDSFAALGCKSPKPRAASVANPPLPPDPAKTGRTKQAAKEHFSRIPKDIQVDDRLASNDYVAMDYSKRTWEDLVVTKGKGFTKGKNKMKKGGFRGGAIDINQKGGVVFFDD